VSVVKSFSVGDGDMFYIKHGSRNFTIIDCCMPDKIKEDIVEEIKTESKGKGVTRFISTHPDDDHILGLKYLSKKIGLLNFYCSKNEATKQEETEDFKEYCSLRDDQKKHFFLYEGCYRKWINRAGKGDSDVDYGSSGINILWPITNNKYFLEALKQAKEGKCPNNISPLIKYSLENGVNILWMGDLESDFMKNIEDDVDMPNIDILFAPHHGRDTGKVPENWLKRMDPKIIVIGEAPSEDLNYYGKYKTITQNSAGDIIFKCIGKKVHVYVSNKYYSVGFLEDEKMSNYEHYIGTLNL